MSTTETVGGADQLIASEQIRALSNCYALGLDQFNLDGLMAPFTEDCVFDATGFDLGVLEGKEELVAFFEHNFEVMEMQMHLFSNFLIHFQGPDSATGTNYLFEDGYTKDGAQITCACLNEDEYVRGDAGWKISRRVVRPLLPPKQDGYQ